MGTPQAIQEDVRWPTAQAQALAAACAGLGDLLDSQYARRHHVANRAQDQFLGNKSNDFMMRSSTNNQNAKGLIGRLQAMRAALAAAEQWAVEEQAARVRAREEEDDRSWWGLKGFIDDIVS
jgi:hypothetical protein